MSIVKQLVPDFDIYDIALKELGPAGYTLAINIRHIMPEFYHTTYPADWVEEYTSKGYAVADPVTQFTAFSTGMKRWDEAGTVKIPVLSNVVIERAKSYGLNHGAVIAKKTPKNGLKQLLSFARSDRPIMDNELRKADELFDDFLALLDQRETITDRQRKILFFFGQGHSRKEVACELNVSEATVKKDVEATFDVLGVNNTTAAVAMAVQRKLISFDQSGWEN